MQTILTSAQMRETDAHTSKHQKIAPIEFMENAAIAFVNVFKKEVKNRSTGIAVLCGPGNNGGDGLAIARLLIKERYKNVKVDLIIFSAKQSDEFRLNLKRLEKLKIEAAVVSSPDEFKFNGDVIIDAILGSGLNKPLAGKYAALVKLVNQQGARIIAVDVPTGMSADEAIPENYNGIIADLVVSFQRPKINFFFPESARAMANFKVVDIGLEEGFIEQQKSDWRLTEEKDLKHLLKPRKNFTHKGTYGHALLVAGNTATMGAALLAANGCVRAGVGLTTVCLPPSGLTALNVALPEVMAMPTNQFLAIESFEKFTSMGIGPGLGINEENEQLFEQLLSLGKPMVIDADALSMLSEKKDLLAKLPPDTILTPHMKEFDRLFGRHENWQTRLVTAKQEAIKRKLVIVLKNQYTFVCLPTGDVFINPVGNPAMASGGMGDVLTGIITAFRAQGLSSADAAKLGIYIHGKTGNRLAKKKFTVSASEVAGALPATLKRMSK
jgi:hydroxyethylthiazole kinase-like uncharacterized protein yjeF